jgi:flagellar hook-associated protein 1 FlgK
MSTFSGLSVALSGLYAQRQGLEVVGQNIANASTDGYSRQRVVLQSVGAPSTPALFSQGTSPGSGVRVTGVQRLRDAFLEAQSQVGHAQLADLSTAHDVVGAVEQLFPEPGDQGLQAHLSDLWNSCHAVANQPASLPARTQLLARATVVTDWLNNASSQLSALAAARTDQLTTLVQGANDSAAQLADLNQAILRGTQSGLPVNELMDQRDQLAMTPAESLGGVTRTDPDGTVGVYVGGSALVRSNRAEALRVATSAGAVQVQWARDGSAVDVSSGTAHAILDAVDVTLPQWSARLDAVANALTTQLNAVHTAGYDLTGAAGLPLLTGTTAATISVALSDPASVAASLVAPVAGVASLDAGNADALAAIGAATSGSPDHTYQLLIVDLGVSSQNLALRTSTQQAIVTNTDGARDSQSGVSLDEEMTNLLSFQRAYEAASRVVNAVDSMLDTLVNRTGLVGR